MSSIINSLHQPSSSGAVGLLIRSEVLAYYSTRHRWVGTGLISNFPFPVGSTSAERYYEMVTKFLRYVWL